MIITRQKNFRDIINKIQKKSVFIVGCSECATLCNTGGETEVLEMKKRLEENSIKITGWEILDPACNLNNDKRLFRKHKNSLENSDSLLVLACGNGCQTVSEIFSDKEIISGNDTLFLGETKRYGVFEKKCEMCGECLLDDFAGFCPVSLCPKSILNGPCGGVSSDKKCEVNKEMDCGWIKIYDFLRKKDRLDVLKKIQDPKNWSKSTEMHRSVKDEL